MTEKKFSRKNFLNQDGFGEDASVFSEITVEHSNDDHWWWNSRLKIRDCRQSITLDIEVSELENTLHKLDTLIDHLIEFRKAVRIHGTEFLKDGKTSKL